MKSLSHFDPIDFPYYFIFVPLHDHLNQISLFKPSTLDTVRWQLPTPSMIGDHIIFIERGPLVLSSWVVEYPKIKVMPFSSSFEYFYFECGLLMSGDVFIKDILGPFFIFSNILKFIVSKLKLSEINLYNLLIYGFVSWFFLDTFLRIPSIHTFRS